MPVGTFIKCLLRFPLDFLFFTFDYLRLMAHLWVKKFHPNRNCTFCFDASNTVRFPRPVKAAAKYGNRWLFKLICPSVARPAASGDKTPTPCCHSKGSRFKGRWIRHGLAGAGLVLVWGGIAGLGLVGTGRLGSLLHPAPAPESASPVPDNTRISNRSIFQHVLPHRSDSAKALKFIAQAREAFDGGDYESAKLAYLNAKKYDPENAEIRLGLGNCYYRLNKGKEALMEFKNAARIDPGAADVHEKLAELYAAGGNLEQVIAHAQNALNIVPGNPEVRLLLAQSFLLQQKPAEARQELESVLKIAGDNAEVLNKAALLYRHLQDNVQSEGIYRKALEIDAENMDSLMGLADLLKVLNKPDESAVLLDQARQVAPDDIRVAVQLAEMALTDGKAAEAIPMYREIIERFPESFQAKARLTQILLRTGQREEGLQLAENLAALDNPVARATGSYILANYYLNIQLFNKALSYARKVVAFNPGHAGAHMLMVKALLAKKDYDGCALALKEILSMDPENIDAHSALGQLLLLQGHKEKGLQALEEVVQKYPDSSIPRFILGQYFYSIRDYAAAQTLFEKAQACEPDRPDVLNQLAMCLLLQGTEVAKACDLAGRLVEKYPGHPSYMDTYGWALYHKGEYEKALQLMTFAQTMLPRNPEIRYHIGMIHYQQKHYDLARTFLDQSLNLAPEFAGFEEARRILDSLPEPEDATL